MLSDLAALYSENTALFAGSVSVLGLVVGSFLNVVIYRLPIMLEREWQTQAAETLSNTHSQTTIVATEHPHRFSLSTPRSACPSCKAPITASQNIPVISWLLLRGRCAACKAQISARYPVVELATALLSGWVGWHFGFGASAACALLVTWALIALTGIDIDHQLLPDNITLPLIWAGLLAAVLIGPIPGQAVPVSASDAVVGAAAGYLSLWMVFHAFRLVTGKEGMGYGDFKLFAALGAWLGWKMLPLIILLAAGTGAVLGLSMIVLRGRDRAAPMPFGPYLATAGWLGMMYGDALITAYLRISGLQH
ncbi:MAG: leader peptidase (prepilin peptidase) / N-methyltransferase [Acetobacteraceae bacterium]|jgi:leader peptidase (prepilin peptidase)/N-methyltransferase|nr:leader peptidase (prepilin peptidase) / N-methyltransferase [Acetobacteraceae bacterium]